MMIHDSVGNRNSHISCGYQIFCYQIFAVEIDQILAQKFLYPRIVITYFEEQEEEGPFKAHGSIHIDNIGCDSAGHHWTWMANFLYRRFTRRREDRQQPHSIKHN